MPNTRKDPYPGYWTDVFERTKAIMLTDKCDVRTAHNLARFYLLQEYEARQGQDSLAMSAPIGRNEN